MRESQVATCEPFLLEALYSAQSPSDYRRLQTAFGALPRASSPAGLLAATLAAQEVLALTPAFPTEARPLIS